MLYAFMGVFLNVESGLFCVMWVCCMGCIDFLTMITVGKVFNIQKLLLRYLLPNMDSSDISSHLPSLESYLDYVIISC